MTNLFPDESIITTKHFDVHQDWEVPISGFFIVAPLEGLHDALKRVKCLDEFTDEEAVELIHLIRAIRKGMREALGIKEIYLFQNEDTEHGFHVWMFPRHAWMEKFGRKIQSVRPIMNWAKENMTDEKTLNEVRDSARKMREYLSSDQE